MSYAAARWFVGKASESDMNAGMEADQCRVFVLVAVSQTTTDVVEMWDTVMKEGADAKAQQPKCDPFGFAPHFRTAAKFWFT